MNPRGSPKLIEEPLACATALDNPKIIDTGFRPLPSQSHKKTKMLAEESFSIISCLDQIVL